MINSLKFHFQTIRLFFAWIFYQPHGSLHSYIRQQRATIENFKMRGRILDESKVVKERAQGRCNHLKGGMCQRSELGLTGSITNGNSTLYAVIKHRFPWGDWWVICQRCHKKWKPGDLDYESALTFPTDNSPSQSNQFVVNVVEARKLTKES